MWVFGYGSLMWDDWQGQFDGQKHEKAILKNYRREFNKNSTVNWGTREAPGPTLGLEYLQDSLCIGSAFEFLDDKEVVILEYLTSREGRSFELKKLDIVLSDGKSVQAYIPVNLHSALSYIGNIGLEQRAKMAIQARGTNGNCVDYVSNIRKKLIELDIKDENVERFWQAIEETISKHNE